jgi:hypothetical protein
MLNTLKFALAAVSTVLAGGYVVSQGDTKPAPEANTNRIPIELASFNIDQQLDQKVTVDIDGTFGDVVKWLKDQGVNFAIADESVSKRRISLHVKDAPLRDAVDAVAAAMGGRFAKKGDIYVFQPGAGVYNIDPFGRADGKDPLGKGQAFEVWKDGIKMEPKAFGKDGDFKVLTDKDFQGLMKLKDGQTWIDEKGMQDLMKMQDGKFKVFNDKNMKDLMKLKGDGKVQVWSDTDGMKKLLKLNDGNFKAFTDKDLKGMKQLGKDGNTFKFFSGDDIGVPHVWVDGKSGKSGVFEFKPDGKWTGKEPKVWIDGKEWGGKGGVFEFAPKGGVYQGKEPKVRIWVNGKEVDPKTLKGKKLDGKNVKIEVLGQDGGLDSKIRAQIEESMAANRKQLEMYRGEKMTDAQRKEIQSSMKDAHAAMEEAMKQLHSPEFKKQMEDAQREIQKAHANGKMTDAQRKEIQKEMEQVRKQMNSPEFKKQMDQARQEMLKARAGGKLSEGQRAEMEKEMARARQEMEKARGDIAKSRVDMEKARAQSKEFAAHAESIKKLLASITPAQWELSKKQGYLKVSDLTEEQRRLFDNWPKGDGDFTMSYSIDGKSLTIKRN